MTRRRQGLRVQMTRWNDIARQLAQAASHRPKCGCSVNAPEANPDLWPCPCGSHCQQCAPGLDNQSERRG